MEKLDVGLIGFGEVGKIFAAGFKAKNLGWVGAWDLKFAEEKMAQVERAAASNAGIDACDSAAGFCAKAQLVISAVTASSTLAVAQQAAQHLRPGSWFLDLNSASPGTKQQAAKAVEAAGAHYVEAGVMTSVPPHGIAVPMLLGGAQARELAARLAPLGLDATFVSERIGVASATKMSRSIMIKGLEALVIESYATARKYGVEDAMLATLAETFPGIDWQKQGLTSSAASRSTASAAPRRCARPRPRCAKPDSSRRWRPRSRKSTTGSQTAAGQGCSKK